MLSIPVESNVFIILFSSLFLLLLILSMFVTALSLQVRRIKKLFRQLAHDSDRGNLDALLEKYIKELYRLKRENAATQEEISRLAKEMQRKKGNVGLVRFNAFHQEGSDLSFSVAIVDDDLNGIVITSIYGRDESRMYAKPVVHGESAYYLTEEEKEAIHIAKKVPLP